MSAARFVLLIGGVLFVWWALTSVIRRYGWFDVAVYAGITVSALFLSIAGLYCLGGDAHG